MLNKWTLILFFCVGFYFWDNQGTSSIKPLYDHAYVIVYGRDSCGITSRTKKQLDKEGISYIYKSVDDRQEADFLHRRMKDAGLETRRYNLPVVDVNGDLAIRPDKQWIVNGYIEQSL